MIRLSNNIARALGVVALVIPAFVQATVSCTGPVSYVGVDSGGLLYTATGTAINAICSTVAQAGFQATPQACKLFYATLLADQLAGKSATVFYNDPAITQCSQITSWTMQPSTYFVATTN